METTVPPEAIIDVAHDDADNPRCPGCGGAVGVTATYCMHCDADFEAVRSPVDAPGGGEPSTSTLGLRLDSNGLVDDTLTVVVGVLGGLVVGAVGTVVLLILTDSAVGVWVGLFGWLVTTAHLATRPSVQEAVSTAADGVALVLLLAPFVVLAPANGEADPAARVVVFATLLGAVTLPAAAIAGVGALASRYVPDGENAD